ncbi:MAG: Zn-dependent alcohol dehydrogenase [Acidimicrobiales bacterium]|nr:Zn-dependent alcohol dehydrogenase [Acidimicrobiales bacterium]
MRAAILRQTGDENLDVVDDLELAGPGPGEVRIKIVAAGLCHSDMSAMTGTIPQPVPAVLGHEGAGDVIAIGEGVTSVKVGDKVIVAWSAPCGLCKACLRNEPHLCTAIMFGAGLLPHFSQGGMPVFGFAGNGTFAEEMVLPQQAVIPIPSDVPYEVGALIGCGVMTGVGAAINTAHVKPGSSVVVFGCGGVGIATIQGAKIAGAAEIIAVDTVDSKLETAKKFGATHAVKPDGLQSTVDSITGHDGADYAFECIGLPATIRRSYEIVRRGGTAVVVGAGRQDQKVEFNSFELFFNEKKFLGCYYGSGNVRTDFHKLIRLYKAGRLDLEGMITERMDISEVNKALENMRNGSVIRQIFTF